MPTTSQSEQKAILQSHLANIKNQSHLMKQCLLENNLLQALKHCSNMLNELRTNQLTPKFYYELYMIIFDSLEILSSNLLASHNRRSKKRSNTATDGTVDTSTPFLADLYELVQYSGNIIPRLYMMIVVGTTYISTKDAPTKEIMKDMIEMCRGVQHPIRGLFLRYYLLQRIKDLLPISTRQDFDETVEFLISNFIEMNKLWVRLQHQGHSSERELRFKERKELKILVGSNLVRLSQIIDDYNEVEHPAEDEVYEPIEYYKARIFPVIVEQIIQCRDHLAQSYLIDVIIQIFPVDFHLATLSLLLQDVFLYLNPSLRKSELVTTLVDRFVIYHKFESDSNVSKLAIDEGKEKDLLKEGEGSGQVLLFHSFWDFYVKLAELDPELPSEEHSTILQAIIKLSLTYEPDNYENLDKVYKYASQKLSKGDDGKQTSQDEDELWLQLLFVPIEHFKTIKNLLELGYFYEFYSSLQSEKFKKQISLAIVEKVLLINETFSDHGEIDGIFRYLSVLIKDTAADSHKRSTAKDLGITPSFQLENASKVVSKDFLQIQEKISKILHLLTDKTDPFKSLSNLMYVRKRYLNKSGENMIYTYPSLINQILNQLRIAGYRRKYLIRKKKELKKAAEQDEEIDNDDSELLLLTSNFKNLSVTIDEFYQVHQQLHSELILNLYLNAASVADQLSLESISYEFYTQCFIVYEENLILNSSGGQQNQNPHDVLGSVSIPYQLVIAIANKLSSCRNFGKENYETLITKITLYASKLLKKQDQCRSVYYCAHLWWWCELFIEGSSPTVEDGEDSVQKSKEGEEEEASTPTLYREPKRVLECLQKSLRVADSCMDPFLSLRLFIEILNRCLIFYIYGNYLVDSRYINGLIELIKTNLENLKSNGDNEDDSQTYFRIEALFGRSLAYIDEQKAMEDRFQDIVV